MKLAEYRKMVAVPVAGGLVALANWMFPFASKEYHSGAKVLLLSHKLLAALLLLSLNAWRLFTPRPAPDRGENPGPDAA